MDKNEHYPKHLLAHVEAQVLINTGLVGMGGDSCTEGRGFESPAPYTG